MSQLTARQLALVEAVKAHAIANYETGGWDVVVETYEDDELAKLIGRARTEQGAIAKVAEVVGVYAERRAEVVALADFEVPAPRDEEDVPLARPVIAIEAAASMDEIHNSSPYALPEATTTGVVCGSCSKEERTRLDDSKAQVRHASAAHVRFCYNRKAEMDAESAAEFAAERATERWFEEGDGSDHDEQLASCYPTGPFGY